MSSGFQRKWHWDRRVAITHMSLNSISLHSDKHTHIELTAPHSHTNFTQTKKALSLNRVQYGPEAPYIYIYIYIYAFSRRFYPKRLTVHSGYTFFYQYVCSLGIEPTTFCAANAMLYHWATGTLNMKYTMIFPWFLGVSEKMVSEWRCFTLSKCWSSTLGGK